MKFHLRVGISGFSRDPDFWMMQPSRADYVQFNPGFGILYQFMESQNQIINLAFK
jgi:hypothetical protein